MSLRVLRLVHKATGPLALAFKFRLPVATAATAATAATVTGSRPACAYCHYYRHGAVSVLESFRFFQPKLLIEASESVRVQWHDPNRRPRFGVSGHWHLGLQHQCLPRFLKVGSTGRCFWHFLLRVLVAFSPPGVTPAVTVGPFKFNGGSLDASELTT